jgi:hypothetical protein
MGGKRLLRRLPVVGMHQVEKRPDVRLNFIRAVVEQFADAGRDMGGIAQKIPMPKTVVAPVQGEFNTLLPQP